MIVCTLRDLTQLAALRWRCRLSERAVARHTGLSIVTVNRLARDEVDRFDFATLGVLCSFFWCEVGELLVFVPDGQDRPPMPLMAVRRSQLPVGYLSPYPIATSIPQRVRQHQPQALATITGLARSTIDRLAAGNLRRIDRATLDTLCRVWNVAVGDLLTVDLPVPRIKVVPIVHR